MRMKRIDQSRQYWALAANPTKYRVEEAVRNSDEDLWLTKGSKLKPGDRVIIWKCKGRDQRRGVIALGEVLTDPQPLPNPDNPYWGDPAQATQVQERVWVHYVRPPGLPYVVR